jgi:uncharacterized protein (DUF885 family)
MKILNISFAMIFTLLLAVAPTVGCSGAPATKIASETKAFNTFMDQTFDEFLILSPEGTAYFGKKENYDKLDDRSEAFDQKVLELSKQKLEALKKFDYSLLTPQAQLTYDLYKKDLEQGIADYKWKDYGYSVNQQYGIHSALPTFMINIHKVENEKDLQDYIARLNEFKRAFEQTGDQVKRSEKQGVVPPKFVFPYIYTASKAVLTGAPFQKSKKDSPLYADFKAKLKKLKLPAEKNKEYMKKVDEAFKNSVKPAYDSLLAVMHDLEKRATNDDGAWKFPNGLEYYNTRLQRVTTTNMTAEQIHQMGLENVARLRKDMIAIKDKLKFKGSLKAFFTSVRKDPKQYYPNTDAGRQAYLDMAQKYLEIVEQKVPTFFRLLPKIPMEIKAVEKFRENGAGKAFYEGPSDDGKRAGVYYVNLKNMKDEPKYEAEALFHHEGVPGHHFQIALGIEMRDLPKYRRYNSHTAFVEGWGLYAERLAKEMGGYQDDYSELGRLSMEMVRACRLVVDTGIHAKKWTRQQAINYFNDNLPVAKGMQVEQIERYIIWPGQATGYMVGMLKIVELRHLAEKELGSKFDIRDFHAVVLQNGSVPLDELEKLVLKYIADKKAQA